MSEFAFEFESSNVKPSHVIEFETPEYNVTPHEHNKSEAEKFAELIAAKEAALEQDVDGISSERAEMDEMLKEINRIKAEMTARVNELAAKRNKIHTNIFDQERIIRDARNELESLKRQHEQALLNENLLKEFKVAEQNFEEIADKLSWRKSILDHQYTGAMTLALAKRAILADKMGLGKTLTSLAYCDFLQAKKVLVVVPDDIVSNFLREIHHWSPHRRVMTLGKLTKQQRTFALTIMQKMDEYICCINYSAWRKDKSLLEDIANLRIDTVILDEAHTIKNTTTSAYKGVKQIILAENSCPVCRSPIYKVGQGWQAYYQCPKGDWRSDESNDEAFARCSVRNVLPMTGTPILNKPQDLFAMLSLVDPVLFRNEKDFLRDYCEQDYYTQKWKFRSGGLQSLTRRLSGRFLARDRKTAGIILPPQTVQVHEVEIDPELYPKQYKVIQQLTKHAAIVLDSGKAMNALAVITLILRQRQANVWPGGIKVRDNDPESKTYGDVILDVGEEVQESAKLDFILNNDGEGLAQEITEGGFDEGERLTIFSQFKTPLVELENRFKAHGISVVRFDGDTSESVRDQVKIDFDKKYCEAPGYEKRWQVVLCNYKTGGQGLNFTDASQMIILDEEWNPGKNEQAYGRIDRMGQTRETTVHVLRSPRTIDTWMAAINDEKRDMIEGFESATDIGDALLNAIRGGEMI